MLSRALLSMTLVVALGGCRPEDEAASEETVEEKVAAATQPFVGEVVPASVEELDALIAERGSLTFLSWNGQWIGMDSDADITFLPGGEAHMFQYTDAMIGYRGTYAIDGEGTVTLNLPTLEGDWPAMSLLIDDSSLILIPKEEAERLLSGGRETNGGGRRGGYWPFRPIPAEDEAQARKDIAERGGR